MPCLNQNIVSAVTFSAANNFRRNSFRLLLETFDSLLHFFDSRF